MTETINKYMVLPTRYITDSANNFWALVPSKITGMQIAVNGVVDTSTAFVTLLYYKNHQIYQQNYHGKWWYKTKITDLWTTTTDPR